MAFARLRYRHARLRRPTVIVRAHERVFGQVVLLKFSRLNTEAENCLEDATEHLIMRAMRSDGDNRAHHHRQ